MGRHVRYKTEQERKNAEKASKAKYRKKKIDEKKEKKKRQLSTTAITVAPSATPQPPLAPSSPIPTTSFMEDDFVDCQDDEGYDFAFKPTPANDTKDQALLAFNQIDTSEEQLRKIREALFHDQDRARAFDEELVKQRVAQNQLEDKRLQALHATQHLSDQDYLKAAVKSSSGSTYERYKQVLLDTHLWTDPNPNARYKFIPEHMFQFIRDPNNHRSNTT